MPTRPTTVFVLAAVLCCLLLPTTGWADQGELSLTPIESIPDAPADGSAAVATAPQTDALSVAAAEPAVIEDALTGTDAEVEARLSAVRDELAREQIELTRLAAALERADAGLDDALSAYAAHLVSLFDAGESVRVRALIDLRSNQDATARAALAASLPVADRAIGERLVAAYAGVERAKLDGATQAQVVDALQVRVDRLVEELRARASHEPKARAASVRADYIFATGAIPGIGYWGDASGGGILTGWMGVTSAAVGGIGCTPDDAALRATGQRESGEASWYGPGFDGNNTANGETYDQEAMTAAHKTLPFGTIVRVYSKATARCAFVRINDRGPYVDGRIIDLSHAAAQAIGLSGVAQVDVEVWAAS